LKIGWDLTDNACIAIMATAPLTLDTVLSQYSSGPIGAAWRAGKTVANLPWGSVPQVPTALGQASTLPTREFLPRAWLDDTPDALRSIADTAAPGVPSITPEQALQAKLQQLGDSVVQAVQRSPGAVARVNPDLELSTASGVALASANSATRAALRTALRLKQGAKLTPAVVEKLNAALTRGGLRPLGDRPKDSEYLDALVNTGRLPAKVVDLYANVLNPSKPKTLKTLEAKVAANLAYLKDGLMGGEFQDLADRVRDNVSILGADYVEGVAKALRDSKIEPAGPLGRMLPAEPLGVLLKALEDPKVVEDNPEAAAAAVDALQAARASVVAGAGDNPRVAVVSATLGALADEVQDMVDSAMDARRTVAAQEAAAAAEAAAAQAEVDAKVRAAAPGASSWSAWGKGLLGAGAALVASKFARGRGAAGTGTATGAGAGPTVAPPPQPMLPPPAPASRGAAAAVAVSSAILKRYANLCTAPPKDDLVYSATRGEYARFLERLGLTSGGAGAGAGAAAAPARTSQALVPYAGRFDDSFLEAAGEALVHPDGAAAEPGASPLLRYVDADETFLRGVLAAGGGMALTPDGYAVLRATAAHLAKVRTFLVGDFVQGALQALGASGGIPAHLQSTVETVLQGPVTQRLDALQSKADAGCVVPGRALFDALQAVTEAGLTAAQTSTALTTPSQRNLAALASVTAVQTFEDVVTGRLDMGGVCGTLVGPLATAREKLGLPDSAGPVEVVQALLAKVDEVEAAAAEERARMRADQDAARAALEDCAKGLTDTQGLLGPLRASLANLESQLADAKAEVKALQTDKELVTVVLGAQRQLKAVQAAVKDLKIRGGGLDAQLGSDLDAFPVPKSTVTTLTPVEYAWLSRVAGTSPGVLETYASDANATVLKLVQALNVKRATMGLPPLRTADSKLLDAQAAREARAKELGLENRRPVAPITDVQNAVKTLAGKLFASAILTGNTCAGLLLPFTPATPYNDSSLETRGEPTTQEVMRMKQALATSPDVEAALRAKLGQSILASVLSAFKKKFPAQVQDAKMLQLFRSGWKPEDVPAGKEVPAEVRDDFNKFLERSAMEAYYNMMDPAQAGAGGARAAFDPTANLLGPKDLRLSTELAKVPAKDRTTSENMLVFAAKAADTFRKDWVAASETQEANAVKEFLVTSWLANLQTQFKTTREQFGESDDLSVTAESFAQLIAKKKIIDLLLPRVFAVYALADTLAQAAKEGLQVNPNLSIETWCKLFNNFKGNDAIPLEGFDLWVVDNAPESATLAQRTFVTNAKALARYVNSDEDGLLKRILNLPAVLSPNDSKVQTILKTIRRLLTPASFSPEKLDAYVTKLYIGENTDKTPPGLSQFRANPSPTTLMTAIGTPSTFPEKSAENTALALAKYEPFARARQSRLLADEAKRQEKIRAAAEATATAAETGAASGSSSQLAPKSLFSNVLAGIGSTPRKKSANAAATEAFVESALADLSSAAGAGAGAGGPDVNAYLSRVQEVLTKKDRGADAASSDDAVPPPDSGSTVPGTPAVSLKKVSTTPELTNVPGPGARESAALAAQKAARLKSSNPEVAEQLRKEEELLARQRGRQSQPAGLGGRDYFDPFMFSW
jgi:hypothetical protein